MFCENELFVTIVRDFKHILFVFGILETLADGEAADVDPRLRATVMEKCWTPMCYLTPASLPRLSSSQKCKVLRSKKFEKERNCCIR